MRSLILVVVVAVLGASCSSSDQAEVAEAASTTTSVSPVTAPVTAPNPEQATSTTTTPPTTLSAPTTQTVPEPEPIAVGDWNRVTHGEGCVCSDGSEFAFWEQAADPTKVVFLLQGGGACWTTATCDPVDGPYQKRLDGDPTNTGIYNREHPDNPFAEYSYVYVPYCTGDVHLGNATAVYSAELTVEHRGAVNAMSAMDWMVEQYPDATDVFVTGMSAGSIPVPVYAVTAAELLPNAAVVGLGDGSGAFPAAPDVFTEFADAWGVDESPVLDEEWAQTLESGGFAGLFIEAASRNPEIDFGRIDYDDDFVQRFFIALAELGSSSSLRAAIDNNEALIEDAGVALSDYVMPGTLHTILSADTFYGRSVDGVDLASWVGWLARGEQPEDVG